MFKHVTKQAPSDESSSDGSEHDPEQMLDGEDADFTGFGDEDAEMEEGDAGANAEAAFWGQADDETLPPNLPSLLDAKTAPIFELSADAKGRKTLVCVHCPDKVLREGTMKEVHLGSSSHKRRAERYNTYLKEHPDLAEDTADPRRIAQFLDNQLRLKKSGGAGFVVNPSGNKRKRRRNKKTGEVKKEGEASDTPREPKGDDAGTDGISEAAGMTALNAKQKRKLKANENKAKGYAALEAGKTPGDESGDDNNSGAAEPSAKKAKPAVPKPKAKGSTRSGKPASNGPKGKPAFVKRGVDSADAPSERQPKKPFGDRAGGSRGRGAPRGGRGGARGGRGGSSGRGRGRA